MWLTISTFAELPKEGLRHDVLSLMSGFGDIGVETGATVVHLALALPWTR